MHTAKQITLFQRLPLSKETIRQHIMPLLKDITSKLFYLENINYAQFNGDNLQKVKNYSLMFNLVTCLNSIADINDIFNPPENKKHNKVDKSDIFSTFPWEDCQIIRDKASHNFIKMVENQDYGKVLIDILGCKDFFMLMQEKAQNKIDDIENFSAYPTINLNNIQSIARNYKNNKQQKKLYNYKICLLKDLPEGTEPSNGKIYVSENKYIAKNRVDQIIYEGSLNNIEVTKLNMPNKNAELKKMILEQMPEIFREKKRDIREVQIDALDSISKETKNIEIFMNSAIDCDINEYTLAKMNNNIKSNMQPNTIYLTKQRECFYSRDTNKITINESKGEFNKLDDYLSNIAFKRFILTHTITAGLTNAKSIQAKACYDACNMSLFFIGTMVGDKLGIDWLKQNSIVTDCGFTHAKLKNFKDQLMHGAKWSVANTIKTCTLITTSKLCDNAVNLYISKQAALYADDWEKSKGETSIVQLIMIAERTPETHNNIWNNIFIWKNYDPTETSTDRGKLITTIIKKRIALNDDESNKWLADLIDTAYINEEHKNLILRHISDLGRNVDENRDVDFDLSNGLSINTDSNVNANVQPLYSFNISSQHNTNLKRGAESGFSSEDDTCSQWESKRQKRNDDSKP